MKKIIASVLIALSVLGTAAAQESQKKFAVGLGGGPLVSLSESSFTYWEFGHIFGLVSGHGNIWASYNMNRRMALRLSVSAGGNSAALNSRESAGKGFYPYRFTSVNSFLDLMVDPRGRHSRVKVLVPSLYVGVGYGYTFGLHPDYYHFQSPTDPNHTFGFRVGFEGCFNVTDWLGLYFDICAEAYTDKYNGLEPSQRDKEIREGYAGFPFDMRLPLSFGVKFRL